ncbi:MAG: hypothetical protein IAE78_23210 [Myxococcus sp.]|nr:hypothetical protein [Myxococcus sp.]
MRALLLSVALLSACTEKSRSTDTRSTTLATAKQRASFLCAYALCASPVRDAAFHVVFHDNAGGLLAGPDDADIRAVVSVDKDDLEKWTRSCTPARVEARPEWLAEIARGTSLLPRSAPDGYRCGSELRAIHVKDGLIVRHVRTE